MNVIIGNLNRILINIYIVREDNAMLYENSRNSGGVENLSLIIPDGHCHIIYLIWYKNGYLTIRLINGRK